eukprot:363531-Chlamydomonas_euryale.AAC.3
MAERCGGILYLRSAADAARMWPVTPSIAPLGIVSTKPDGRIFFGSGGKIMVRKGRSLAAGSEGNGAPHAARRAGNTGTSRRRHLPAGCARAS